MHRKNIQELYNETGNLMLHTKNYLSLRAILDSEKNVSLIDKNGDPVSYSQLAATSRNITANITATSEAVEAVRDELEAAVRIIKGDLAPALAESLHPGCPIVASACGIRRGSETLELFEAESSSRERKQQAKEIVVEISLDHIQPVTKMLGELGSLQLSLQAKRFVGLGAQWQKAVDVASGFITKRHFGEVYRLPENMYSV